MMHLHLLKAPAQFVGGGEGASSGGALSATIGGASGKGHPETILLYSVPTKQVHPTFVVHGTLYASTVNRNLDLSPGLYLSVYSTVGRILPYLSSSADPSHRWVPALHTHFTPTWPYM